MLLFIPMGTKSNIKKLLNTFEAKRGGYLFDDTPTGILEMLVIGGGMAAGLTFAPTLVMALMSIGFVMKVESRNSKNRVNSSIQYLKRHRYIRVVASKEGKGVRVEVTEEGKSYFARTQMRKALLQPIERPKQWDKKWRIIMFDISTPDASKRSAFRRLINRLGTVMLQKSVWIYPYDCSPHVRMLKELFDLSDSEIRVVLAESIGDDSSFKKHFKL
jgi:CRISPR-associated endonuclease Cas2